jgi:hypothetical protein
MGYNSLYFIQNVGSLCFTIFAVPLSWICLSFFHYLSSYLLFGRWLQKSRDLMFYNSWISFVSENYLFFSVCAALNVYYFRWDTPGNFLNSLLTVIVGTVLGLYLLFLPCFYLRSNNLLLIDGVGGA